MSLKLLSPTSHNQYVPPGYIMLDQRGGGGGGDDGCTTTNIEDLLTSLTSEAENNEYVSGTVTSKA